MEPFDKRTARELQRKCEDAAGTVAVATAGTGVAVSTTPAFVPIVSLGAFFVVAANELARRMGNMADDPPRRDFTSSTHASHLDVDVNALMRRAMGREREVTSRPLGDRVVERLVDCAVAADGAAGYARACVRAYERMLGALEQDELEHAEARAYEAKSYADRVAIYLRELHRSAGALAAAVREHTQLRQAAQQPEAIDALRRGPPFLNSHLPDTALAALFEGGIKISDIRAVHLRYAPEDPWRTAAEAAEEMGQTAARMAISLGEWTQGTPSSDNPDSGGV